MQQFLLYVQNIKLRHCNIKVDITTKDTKTPFTSSGPVDSKVTTDITMNLENKIYYHCSIIVTTYAYTHKIKNTIMKRRRQIGGSSLVVKKKSKERRKCRVNSHGVPAMMSITLKQEIYLRWWTFCMICMLYMFSCILRSDNL